MTVEVRVWICNYIAQKTLDVITYPCPSSQYGMDMELHCTENTGCDYLSMSIISIWYGYGIILHRKHWMWLLIHVHHLNMVWIWNYIAQKTLDVITYPCPSSQYGMDMELHCTENTGCDYLSMSIISIWYGYGIILHRKHWMWLLIHVHHLNMVWIWNYIAQKTVDVITYPCRHLIRVWICNYIAQKTLDVITYPCPSSQYGMDMELYCTENTGCDYLSMSIISIWYGYGIILHRKRWMWLLIHVVISLGYGYVITLHRKRWMWLLIHVVISIGYGYVITLHRKHWMWLLIRVLISLGYGYVITLHRKHWMWLLIHVVISLGYGYVITLHRKHWMWLLIHVVISFRPC